MSSLSSRSSSSSSLVFLSEYPNAHCSQNHLGGLDFVLCSLVSLGAMAVYTILLFSSLVLFWGDFFVVLGTKAWSSRVLNAQSLSYSPAFLGDLYSTILKLTGHHDDHPVDPTNGLPLPLESGVGNQRTKTKTNDLDLCDC